MGLFNKKISTVIDFNSSIKDDLNLTNHSVFHLHGYVAKSKDMTTTSSGKFKSQLPEKSNLQKIDKLLYKTCKRIPNCDILVSNNDGIYKEMYTDNFGRFMASKIVDSYGLTYSIRGDIASQLTNEGNLFIQCERGLCSVVIPNHLTLDFKKFSPKKSIKGV